MGHAARPAGRQVGQFSPARRRRMRSFATLALLMFACTDPTTPAPALRIDRLERNAEDPSAYFVHGELGRVSGPVDATALRPLLPAIATTLGIPSADLIADRAD